MDEKVQSLARDLGTFSNVDTASCDELAISKREGHASSMRLRNISRYLGRHGICGNVSQCEFTVPVARTWNRRRQDDERKLQTLNDMLEQVCVVKWTSGDNVFEVSSNEDCMLTVDGIMACITRAGLNHEMRQLTLTDLDEVPRASWCRRIALAFVFVPITTIAVLACSYAWEVYGEAHANQKAAH